MKIKIMINSKEIVKDVIKLSNYFLKLIQNDFIQHELNMDRNIEEFNIDINPLVRTLLYSRINKKIDELLESYNYSTVAYDMIFEKKLYFDKVFNCVNKKVLKTK